MLVLADVYAVPITAMLAAHQDEFLNQPVRREIPPMPPSEELTRIYHTLSEDGRRRLIEHARLLQLQYRKPRGASDTAATTRADRASARDPAPDRDRARPG